MGDQGLRLFLLGPFSLEHGTAPTGFNGLSKPKLVALLSYLAAAPSSAPRSRDTLLGLFWPERDEASARHALRQSLFELRQALGEDIFDGRRGDVVALGAEVWSDVAAFRAACDARSDTAALALYRGELLSGFHLSDTPDFEQWLSQERRALRADACAAATRLADAAEAAGDLGEAAVRLAEATELAPYSETLFQRRLQLLDRLGDRAGALLTYERLVVRLQADLGTSPAPETQHVIAQIRRRAPARMAEPEVSHPEPAAPGPAPALTPEPPALRAWRRRWPRAALIGGGALVAIALGVGWRTGRLGAAHENVTLVMADPVASGPLGDVARAVNAALRIDLPQSGGIQVFGNDQVGETRRRMGRDTGALDLPTAREVAIRDGFGAVLVTEVERLGNGYQLAARVLDARSGAELQGSRAAARDSTRLFDAIAELSASLRHTLGESRFSILVSAPLARVSTSSLEALQLYSQADAMGEPFEPRVVLLREALARDSNFAMAYWRLATIYAAWGQPSEGRAAVERAYTLRARLPEPERTLVDAAHLRGSGDVDRARAMVEALLERWPDEPEAITVLTDMYMRRGEWAKAERYARRGHRGVDGYNLMVVAAAEGDYDLALSTLDTTDGMAFTFRSLGELQAARGRYDAAETSLRRYLDGSTESRGNSAGARGTIAQVAEVQGRIADAIRWLETDLAEGANSELTYNRTTWLARLDLQYRADTAGALRRMGTAMARFPLERLAPIDRPYVPVARIYRQAGRLADARRLFLAQQTVVTDTSSPQWQLAAAGLESLDGRHAEAARRLERLLSRPWPECPACGMYPVADEWRDAGEPDSAMAWYRRALGTPGLRRLSADAPRHVNVLGWMAERFAATGHPDSAAATLRQIVALWSGADAPLRPRVAAALDQLAALGGTALRT